MAHFAAGDPGGLRHSFCQLYGFNGIPTAFIVGRDGATHAPRIISSSGDGAFDMAALAAAAVLHYRPALYNRVPVAVYVRFPVRVQQRMQ